MRAVPVRTNIWGLFIVVKSTWFGLGLNVVRRFDNQNKRKMIKKYNAIYNTKTCRLVINNIANTATSKVRQRNRECIKRQTATC